MIANANGRSTSGRSSCCRTICMPSGHSLPATPRTHNAGPGSKGDSRNAGWGRVGPRPWSLRGGVAMGDVGSGNLSSGNIHWRMRRPSSGSLTMFIITRSNMGTSVVPAIGGGQASIVGSRRACTRRTGPVEIESPHSTSTRLRFGESYPADDSLHVSG